MFCIFVSIVIYEIFDNKSKGIALIEIVSFGNTLILLIFIVAIINFCIKILYLKKDPDDFFKDTFVCTYEQSTFYNLAYLLESILFGLLIFKLVIFIKLNNHANFLFISIDFSAMIFIKYFVFLIVMILYFAIIGYMIFGSKIDLYNSFENALMQVIMITLGYYPIQLYIKYNEIYAIPYLCSVFLFMLFLLYSLISQVYAESLRKTVIKYGYPDDKEQMSWAMDDYIKWLFFCFKPKTPEEIAKEAKKGKNEEEDDEEEEDQENQQEKAEV